MPWNIVYDALSCDSMVNAFEGLALDLLDRHAPMVLVKPLNKNNQPWFDSRVQLAIYERNIAKRMWKNNRSLRNHNEFIRLRNKAARIIKIAYYAPRLNDKLPSRVLWKNLKSIGITSTENHLPPFSNDQFNNYLLSSVPNSACPSRYSDIPITHNHDTVHNFSFRNISFAELFKSIFVPSNLILSVLIIFQYTTSNCYFLS